jgi:hypothetical protein
MAHFKTLVKGMSVFALLSMTIAQYVAVIDLVKEPQRALSLGQI